MRASRVLVAWSLALGACETRYGSYLVVDGEPQGITFDRVELFFGDRTASGIPATPLLPAALGERFERQFIAADELDLEVARTSVDFYLPEASTQAGNYVAVVAFLHETPVGIAELADYVIANHTVYQYELALQPWTAEAERWGTADGPPCLRWTRKHGPTISTVAVVRADDIDCDGVKPPMDCQDLQFCAAGTSCGNLSTACIVKDSGDCMIGSCREGGGCIVDECTIPGVCDSNCDMITELRDRLECAVEQVGLDHLEARVPVNTNLFLCPGRDTILGFATPDPTVQCDDPRIEWQLGASSGVVFTVVPPPALPPPPPGFCHIQVTLAPGATYVGDHHILISVPAQPPMPTNPLKRWSFVVGVVPNVVQCDDPAGDTIVTGSGEVMTCSQ